MTNDKCLPDESFLAKAGLMTNSEKKKRQETRKVKSRKEKEKKSN